MFVVQDTSKYEYKCLEGLENICWDANRKEINNRTRRDWKLVTAT